MLLLEVFSYRWPDTSINRQLYYFSSLQRPIWGKILRKDNPKGEALHLIPSESNCLQPAPQKASCLSLTGMKHLQQGCSGKSAVLWAVRSVWISGPEPPPKQPPFWLPGTQHRFALFESTAGGVWYVTICLVGVYPKEVRLFGCKIFSAWGISSVHLLEESCIPSWLEALHGSRSSLLPCKGQEHKRSMLQLHNMALPLSAWKGAWLSGNLGLPVVRLSISLTSNTSTIIYGLCKAHICDISCSSNDAFQETVLASTVAPQNCWEE